jgi:hypothetical protein
MKKLYILSFVLISFFSLKAQNQPKGFHLERPVNMQAILAKKPSLASGFSSVSEARSIINDIMDVSDIQQNFRVESTTQVDNAAAVIYMGTRYILYNPSFIDGLDNAARDKWASISVIGHEIGHHLLGHTLDGRGSQIPKELEADEYSGLVLRRMGASLQQAQLAMKLIASPYASATHPGESDRLAAIARGWNSTTTQPNRGNSDVTINTPDDRRSDYPSDQQNYPRYPDDTRTYPSPRDRRNPYPTDDYPSPRRGYPSTGDNRSNYPGSNNGGYGRRNQGNGGWRGNNSANVQLAYDIRFSGNNRQQYYITSQNQVIMLRGNQGIVVAKVASTNRSNYPYVIYDDQQQIFIDRGGNLFSETGRRIGFITRHL